MIDPRFHPTQASRQIREKLRMVERDEKSFGMLSTGEKCAVALVLNRLDLGKKAYGSLLSCAYRLGPEWLAASLYVQETPLATDAPEEREFGEHGFPPHT